ncbi:MAG: hypothetical protein AMJ79_09680 [Phycisphaerae bacterium SM23_30]|nr:MAG: hypothetical protein AMJ79_09680 [Phycisphaerae bacterium SM23_30]
MSSPFSGFANLPTPFKAGVIIAGGGGLVGTIYMFIRHFDARVIWVILIGLALVALLLAAYKLLLNWLHKRKSKDFRGGVEGDSALKPGGISKAEHLARLDDLQKKFEEGIEKFRSAGKDLYSLPWIMIVGEPGSGKTEAVRHCNVGFPPGLHEPLQGTGGTINMNWWFTDHAVILDTAGRLMFEELEAGRTTEWQHFLNLLKKYRHNCPVNGVLLVIPADTLSTDTADEIERKAEKIAQQFDTIRRTLDVRFPVFVVVAKTDKIDGFREFFDDLTDPQLQHQILGWSNPAPLDESFNPEMIDKYLEVIQARLRRYRMGLLRDPIPGEDARRRTDEVDSLYAFPRQLLKVAPRLRRYLELVFSVGGQWSGKPLFLRGIYFTSSMREGEALDVELAETLGVPVESLPDGKVWEKDRAYFLRDLFMNKVFREKGLVTRAANARRHHRWRKAAVLGAAAFSAVLLLLFTTMGAYSLENSIGNVSDYFVAAKDEGENCRYWIDKNPQMYWFPIVEQRTPGSTEYIYVGDQTFEFFEDSPTRIQFLGDLRRQVDKGVKIPGVFLLARAFIDAIEAENLQETQKTLFEAAVLRPLVDAARWKMTGGARKQPPPWTPRTQPLAAAALAQLIRLEAFRLGAATPAGSTDEAMYQWTDPLLDYVLHDSDDLPDPEQFLRDKQALNLLARQTYENAADWPPELISLHNDSLRIMAAPDQAVYQGIESFIEYWKGQGGMEGPALKNIRRIEAALKQLETAEQNTLTAAREFIRQENQLDTSAKLNALMKQWDPDVAQLSSAALRVNELLDTLQDTPLDQAYDQGVREVIRQMQDSFAPLLSELPSESEPPPAEKTEIKPQVEPADNILTNVRRRLDEAAQTVEGELLKKEYLGALQLFQERFLAPLQQYRLYQLRMKIWELAQGQLAAPVEIAGVAELADAIDDIDKQSADARDQIGVLARHQQLYLVKDTLTAADSLLKVAQRRRTSWALNRALASLPKSADGIQSDVAERAADVAGPRIALTRFDGRPFDKTYDPQAAALIFSLYRRIQTRLNDLNTPLLDRNELGLSFNQFKQGYIEYLGRYYNYWAYTVPRQLESGAADYQSFFLELSKITTFAVRSPLDDLGKKMDAAFGAVAQAVPPELTDDIKTALNHINLNCEKNINRNDAYQIYAQQCDKILTSLNGLGADPFAAAQNLIRLPARDLRERFLITSEKAPLPVEFVDYYWYSLNQTALELLVQEMDLQRRESLEQLKQKCDRFPLNRPQPDDLRFMTPQDVTQARLLYNRISFAGAELPPEKIAELRVGIEEIDRLYDSLRRPKGLSQTDSLWLENLGKVLNALPGRPGTFDRACSVRLPDQETQKKLLAPQQQPDSPDAHLISPVWRYVSLKQGPQETNAGTENPQDAPLGELIYGAEGLVFHFYRYADSDADRSLSVPGPWAPLRLLHQGTVDDLHAQKEQQPLSCSWQLIPPQQASPFLRPGEQSDKVWLVKLAVTGNEPQELRWICIKLIFEHPLPRPIDWPIK